MPMPWEAPANAVQAEKLPAGGKADGGVGLSALMPRPTSTFEFGPTIAGGGSVMRGLCSGADPDIVQACTWTLEPVEARQRKAAFRIEF
jgi:hypothetical protein